MADLPETRFARNGEVHLAYQVFGSGPIDILFVDDWVHHVELVWGIPEFARFLRRLGAFARVIHFDRRGTGLSDPVPLDELPDLETQVEDVIAVLDAAGSDRPAIVAVQVGTQIAELLAASHPDRCRALVLYAAAAMAVDAPDHPFGNSPEAVDAMIQEMTEGMLSGDDDVMKVIAPSRASDRRFLEALARFQRSSVRPGTIGHFFRQSLLSDVRHVLPVIQAPTLVIHRTDDQVVPIELGREVASMIPGARFVELPGADHLWVVGDAERIVDEIELFLTGARSEADPDRVLATLLFTDIVDSTRTAAGLGDRRWRDLLDEHHVVVRRELDRFVGRELATTGDGFLAAFEGPARAVRCALAITSAVADIGLEIRAGIHTGEIDLRGTDVGGLTVHIAARVAAMAEARQVLVSSTVKDLLVGSGLGFDSRGEHELKGVPGAWRLFAASRVDTGRVA